MVYVYLELIDTCGIGLLTSGVFLSEVQIFGELLSDAIEKKCKKWYHIVCTLSLQNNIVLWQIKVVILHMLLY